MKKHQKKIVPNLMTLEQRINPVENIITMRRALTT